MGYNSTKWKLDPMIYINGFDVKVERLMDLLEKK